MKFRLTNKPNRTLSRNLEVIVFVDDVARPREVVMGNGDMIFHLGNWHTLSISFFYCGKELPDVYLGSDLCKTYITTEGDLRLEIRDCDKIITMLREYEI